MDKLLTIYDGQSQTAQLSIHRVFVLTAAAAEDRNFKNYANTQEEEDAYDYVKERGDMIQTSFAGSVAHIIKGALGGGILSGPVAYKRAGVLVAVPLNIMFGIFMCYGLYLLVRCKKVLMKRTRRTHLSYADCGEACLMIFPKKGLAKFSKLFRYSIDAAVCMDLFGACTTYQIVVAKSLKQLIENTQTTKIAGAPGYPSLRIYLLIMLPFFCLICLIRHLKYLAPFSHAANGVVASSIMMTIYYCFQYNPQFEGLVLATSFEGTFQFLGMSVFAMSCSGVVIAIEGNMKDPTKFTACLLIGHLFIIVCTTATSFFGYAAFLEKAEAPFTINFPMTTLPKMFKAGICIMLYITHGLNFWVPFNLCWYYIKSRVNQDKIVFWERIFRVIFVTIIGVTGAIFPSITALMGLIGCLCLANMAIIYPNIIVLFVEYERPGFGAFKWRVWRSVFFISVGMVVLTSGTLVNLKALINVLITSQE